MIRMLPKRARRGFSLIELLIVVAIIAALVGVAVPFFQDNLSEAQKTKAAQDLEVIKKAIALYDAREPKPLTGTDLKPLLGRYMQELPKDPWGNDYLFDGAMGFLCSYGADALPRGSGGDTDIVIRTKPELMISRCQYQGSWGRPTIQSGVGKFATGNKFIISLTKPAFEALPGNTAADIVLLRNLGSLGSDPIMLEAAGSPYGSTTAGPGWDPGTWRSNGNATPRDPLHHPEVGVIVVYCAVDQAADSTAQGVTPTMAVDFHEEIELFGTTCSLRESNLQNVTNGPKSPMDSAVYGTAAVTDYAKPPQRVEFVDGQRRGIRIEKY